MDLNDLQTLARKMMDDQGLQSWTFRWDKAKSRLGYTLYKTKTISLSRTLANINSFEQNLDTIRHEIAHALTGPGHGHDKMWKDLARTLGAVPHATTRDSVSIQGRYKANCWACGKAYYRHRLSGYSTSCGRCSPHTYDETFELDWRENVDAGKPIE